MTDRGEPAVALSAGVATTARNWIGHWRFWPTSLPSCCRSGDLRAGRGQRKTAARFQHQRTERRAGRRSRRAGTRERCRPGPVPDQRCFSSRQDGWVPRQASARMAAEARLGHCCTRSRPDAPPIWARTSQPCPSVRIYTSRRPRGVVSPFHQCSSTFIRRPYSNSRAEGTAQVCPDRGRSDNPGAFRPNRWRFATITGGSPAPDLRIRNPHSASSPQLPPPNPLLIKKSASRIEPPMTQTS